MCPVAGLACRDVLLASTSTLITGIAVPVLLALGAALAWAVRSTIEDYREAERQLADERRTLYEAVLEPFVLPFIAADDEATVEAETNRIFASPEYKRAVFELTLYASDDVVRAFGDMTNNQSLLVPVHSLVLWSRALLAVRKSLGNKGTQLKPSDILRTTINDIDVSPDLVRVLNEKR